MFPEAWVLLGSGWGQMERHREGKERSRKRKTGRGVQRILLLTPPLGVGDHPPSMFPYSP